MSTYDTDYWLVDAARQLRDEEQAPDEVDRLIATISTTLGRIRYPGRSLATDNPSVQVSDRAVRQLLARAVRQRLHRLLLSATLDGDDNAVTGVHVGLVAHFGDDLLSTADLVRDLVSEVLRDAIGDNASHAALHNIEVQWQDLYAQERPG